MAWGSLEISSGREFQRDAAAQARVLRFVNHAHATTAQFFQDAVVGNAATDDGGAIRHWRHILRERLLTCKPGASASICAGITFGLFTHEKADFAEILIDLAIGLEQGRLVVGHVVRAAVIAHDFLHVAQFIRGHGGKKVMLDLAGEAAGGEINSRMIFDVAAGEDLFAQEIHSGVALLQRHALMIGREY